MPPSTKSAPSQQSNLNQMWNRSKKAKQAIPEPSPQLPSDADAMEVDVPPVASSSQVTADDAGIESPTSSQDAPTTSVKRKSPENVAPSTSNATKGNKRRRIVDSDDEGEADPVPPITVTKPSSNPPASSSSLSPKKASKKNDKGPKKGQPMKSVNDLMKSGKRKAPAVVEEDEEEAASAASDGGEDEIPPEEEEDDFLVSDGEETKAAVKNAQMALSHVIDVDVDGGWKPGSPIPYKALTHVFAKVEATTKRLEITSLLMSFLLLVIERSKPGDSEPLRQAVYLCINRLCPDYMGLELGIGESLLQKAIAQSTGRKPDAIKADFKEVGDLGLVAMNSKGSQRTLFKPKPLSVPFVFSKLTEIAKVSGKASQTQKVQIITNLLAACDANSHEAKYIIRSLEGKLRIGLAERTLIVALAHACVLWENKQGGSKWDKEKLAQKLEEGANIVKAVYSELPTYDMVVPALLKGGIAGLREECKLTPGVPLKPMLAKPTKAITEVLDRFEGKRFTCEYKYDGERAQVHRLANGTLAVFSRNSEDMSAKYPDLVDQLPKAIKEGTKAFVLDCEAVAFDKETMQLLPFQELSRRKRKDVKAEDIKVKVCLFAFDLLYLNDEPLLHKTLLERRQLLREHFNEVPGEFSFAKSSDGESSEEIQVFLDESVKDGCEGLMVKMIETDASYYEPSRRSMNWLKLKKDYLQGVGDTFDLVVVGAYHGKGKRTSVYGAFLLACYDPDSEKFQTVCKLGTGFSEEALKANLETLKELEVPKCRGDVDGGGAKPDVWFEPKFVWEILAADLSLSPVYAAAKGAVDERGISLRFPRFIRIRDDKDVDDATTSEQVAEAYERQALATSKTSGKKGKRGAVEDDFW
ncbi:DNA ligase I [Clavulina sp. PMI_390]|nr:DNA ligase I [Clavulina sp. PMI_390]